MFRIEIRKEMETKNRNRIESLLDNCKHSAHDKSRFNSLRDSKISPNAISPTTTPKGGGKRQQYPPPISQNRQHQQNSMETWLFTHR